MWFDDVIRKKEEREFSAEAQFFIKGNSFQWHIECCTSVATKVRFALKQYADKAFQQRWGSKAEIRILSLQGERDFALDHTNTKKRTQAIAFTAQVVKLTICGLKSGRRMIRVGTINGEPHEVEIQLLIQTVKSEVRKPLFYHLLHTLADVQAYVWEKLKDEATRFTNFPLPHLLWHLKLDKESLTTAHVKTKEEIIDCFSQEIINRSKGAVWNEEKGTCFAVDEDQDDNEEADE